MSAEKPQPVALRSCPFCSGSDLFVLQNENGWWHVYCDDCGSRGPTSEGESRDLGIETWNRRPPQRSLSDAEIIEIRDEHLPSQGESFDCLAFARAVLSAASQQEPPCA